MTCENKGVTHMKSGFDFKYFSNSLSTRSGWGDEEVRRVMISEEQEDGCDGS